MPNPASRQLAFSRTLMALIFLVSGMLKALHYSSVLSMMREQGVWLSSLALPAAMTIEVLGGLALMSGYRVRATSLVLALYLIPVTLIFHRFWNASGLARQQQLIEFLKNASIIGGLLSLSFQQKVLSAFTGGTLIQLRRESFERRKSEAA